MLVTRPRPLLGQVLVETLNLETCNVYLPKAFQKLIHGNVADIVFFIVCKIYILLALSFMPWFHNDWDWWCNRKFHNGSKWSPSDCAIRDLNSSCVVIVVSCATDWSADYVSIVISETTRTACRQEMWS